MPAIAKGSELPEWQVLADSATSWPVAGNRFRLTEIDPMLSSVTVRFPVTNRSPRGVSQHQGEPSPILFLSGSTASFG
jgi:hypothetical protein